MTGQRDACRHVPLVTRRDNRKRLTGYEHPSYQGRRKRYADLLREMGRSEAEVDAALREVGAE